PQASTSTPPPMIVTPAWMAAIRGIQFFLAVVILGLSAAIIHWVYLDELGLAVAISLFTWIIVAYAVLTEKLPSIRKLYHAYAVLALDLFLVILWLATMGACAARRATFTVPVNASCTSDGSAFNSGSCSVFKRAIIVMGQGALAMFAAIAGLSALQFVFFLVTFVWSVVQFARSRKLSAPAAQAAASQGEVQMESKQPFIMQQAAYQQPQNGQQQQHHQQQQQQQQQQQFYPPQHYQPQPPQQYQEMSGQQQPPQQYQEMPGQQPQPYHEMPGQQQQPQYPQQTTSPAPTYNSQPPQEYQQYQQQQYPAQ
ncbi:hypothetical protein LX36DRAFT_550736, partial [Colletotrichum falcatum]